MKPRDGITLPASFVVTVSHAGTEVQVAPADNDILTVAEVAELLKCKRSSVYNLTRIRTRARYDNPIPVLAWIIHQGSSQKRKDALKGMMNTGLADPAFPFGASIT